MARTTTNVSTLPFVVDLKSLTNEQGGQIDWTTVRRQDHVTVVADGTNSQAATTLGVEALTGPIPSGTTLQFGADEFATTTAAAAAGATSIAVGALVNAIEDGDTAQYYGVGVKSLPAGKTMARLASGKLCPRATRPGSETAIGFLASGAEENNPAMALTGYGVLVGGVLWENLLPDYSNAAWSTFKSEMQNAGVGTGFGFRTYNNSLD